MWRIRDLLKKKDGTEHRHPGAAAALLFIFSALLLVYTPHLHAKWSRSGNSGMERDRQGKYQPAQVTEPQSSGNVEANPYPGSPPYERRAAKPAGPRLPVPNSPGGPAPSGQVMKFPELPSSVRDSLAIEISMLVYAGEPAGRSLTVNGFKLKEGEDVSDGLKLEEITPEGAFFSYKGLRFFKTVRD